MRKNRMQSGNTNPANYFFQWKSEHQKFYYYDKETKKNVFIDMPFKFLGLSKYITVKGWNQKKKYAILSNEVQNIKDELIVNAYSDGNKTELARGPWNDIKTKIDNEGGKFTQSVYIMLPNGEVANIQLNGASLSTWFSFQKNQTDKFFDNWVVVNGFKEGTQGAVTFTYPVFEWGTTLNAQEQSLAEQADQKIDAYEQSYFTEKVAKENYRQNSEADKYLMEQSKPPVPSSDTDAELAMHQELDDDLPF